jgi:diketogulonate reductase-like aldo/keto reductase
MAAGERLPGCGITLITSVAQHAHTTAAQVALASVGQRGRTTFPITSTRAGYIQENVEMSALSEDAMREIREGITTNVRFNAVVQNWRS